MKGDMGGAASILGAMRAIALLKPKINVIAAIPSAENMPSGSATRPGDVLHHRGGKTSEVLNTDAEGRLVLADALAYLSEKEPRAIVDTATLTGACMVALGEDLWGVFGTDRGLVRDLLAAGDAAGEPVELLHRPYRKLIDSPIADVKNIGKRYGRDHGRAVPGGLRGRRPMGPRGHRGSGVRREGRRPVSEGCDGRPGSHARRVPARPGREALSVVETQPYTGPVLAVFAHPDDAEISAGGTLAKWASAGREVHLLVLTNGDRGSSDPWRDRAELAATRAAETKAAAGVLGAHGCPYPGCARRRAREHHRDPRGGDPPDPDGAGRDRSLLRPDRVVLRGALLQPLGPPAGRRDRARRRVPRGGQPHYFAEQLSEGLDVREVRDVWLGWTNEPNHLEDVTGHFRTKMDALAAHASQVEDGIAFFKDELEREAAEAGAKIGVGHAEEFRVLALS